MNRLFLKSIRLFPLQVMLAFFLAIITPLVFFSPKAAYASIPKKTVGYLVYWNKTAGLQTIDNNVSVFSEISPWAYTASASGDVVVDPSGGSNITDSTTRSHLASLNLIVVPTIHNLINGSWDGTTIHNILSDSQIRAHHIDSIVNMIDAYHYDGVDIDYENLQSGDRDAYSSFIHDLATRLHQQHYILAVDVYGKTSEPGDWNGPQAQDYQSLGQSADEVRIFLYDYNPGTTGPIAPYSWTSNVIAFAKTKISAAKIIQGVPLYGYDWAGSNYPTTLTWAGATATASQNSATVNFDSTDHAPNYTYSSGGVNHTVWFENQQSTGYKLDLTNNYDIGGVTFWNVGNEDPGTWNTVNNKLNLVR